MAEFDELDAGGDVDYDDNIHAETEFEELSETIAGPRPELSKIYLQHPELAVDYREMVYPKLNPSVLPGGGDGNDPSHTTYPYITLYEKTKIIGVRANQLSQGAKPFINVPEYVTDVIQIARLEYEQKRLPFIIKRPLPNGKYEYWRLTDLMNDILPSPWSSL